MTKIRVYYHVVDCGDGSYSVEFHKNSEELATAIAQEEDEFSYLAETNGSYVDFVVGDYEVVE